MTDPRLRLPPGPFTIATARTCGVSERQLGGRGFARILPTVYVTTGTVQTTRLRAEAALLLAPEGSAIARHTAGVLWGGVVPRTSRVHLVVPSGRRMRVRGVDARERGDSAIWLRRGIRLTSPAQTFCDLAQDLDLVDLVVLGDSLVGRRVVTAEELTFAAGAYQGPGARRARRAARFVREGVDSPMETRLRMLLVLAGLPEPVVNLVLRDEKGQWRFRLDLAYPQWQLAVEYDGRQHAESTAQWTHDLERREWFDSTGWRLLVVLSAGVFESPQATLDRIVAAIRSRGGTAAIRSAEWERYFPGRIAA